MPKSSGRLLPTANVIGLPVSVATMDGAAKAIFDHAAGGGMGYVCVANTHMLTTAHKDPGLAKIIEEASVVTSDGMPLVWALHQRGHALAERVYGPGLSLNIFARAQAAQMPVYLYGSTPERADSVRAFLSQNYPTLDVTLEVPPMLPKQPGLDPEVVARIKATGAKLVFVGVGCPKQEYWMAAHRGHIPAILLGVGAAFDIMAGVTREAPAWMQSAGLEWLYRLGMEPGRLWRRYLVGNSLYTLYRTQERLGLLRPPSKA